MNIDSYYKQLLSAEGQCFTDLINKWDQSLILLIEKDFEVAIMLSQLKSTKISLRRKSSNQSAGNQICEQVISLISRFLKATSITPCKGSGYPDKILKVSQGIKIALEVKATGVWRETDSNRRVLTCSSRKLRKYFYSPVYHLLMTLIYNRSGDIALVDSIRFDFIEPSTQVNIRLEASVSHKLLCNKTHHSKIF